jgi:hypothetical protein
LQSLPLFLSFFFLTPLQLIRLAFLSFLAVVVVEDDEEEEVVVVIVVVGVVQ